MDFLPVAGVDVPTTYQEWVDLDGAHLASVGQVFTDKLLIKIDNSYVYRCCPLAFSVTSVNGVACAPITELESLYGRFVRPDDSAMSLKFCEAALTPAALTRVDGMLNANKASYGGLEGVADAHELVRRLAHACATLAPCELVMVGKDDFIALEASADRNNNQGGWISDLNLELLAGQSGTLDIYGDLAVVLGPRARDASAR